MSGIHAAAGAAAGVAAVGAFIACIRGAIEPAVRSIVDPLLKSLEAQLLASISAKLAAAKLPALEDQQILAAAQAVLTAVVGVLEPTTPPPTAAPTA